MNEDRVICKPIYLCFCDFSSIINLIIYLICILFKGNLLKINIVDMPKFRNDNFLKLIFKVQGKIFTLYINFIPHCMNLFI